MNVIATLFVVLQTTMPQTPPPQAAAPSAVMETERILSELAIETGRNNEITPIPLLDDQGQKRGELYDRFLLGAIAARAAIARGETPATSAGIMPGKGLLPLSVIVVARPWTCGNRQIAVDTIELTPVLAGTATQPARRIARAAAGEEASRLLPGVELPADSVVMSFASVPLLNAMVAFRYTEPACTGETTVNTPVRQIPVRVSGQMTTKLPPEATDLASPSIVRVRGAVDRTGRLRETSIVDGPERLASTALAMAQQLKVQPATINGVPTVQVVALPIAFTVTGQPAPPPATPGTAPGGRTTAGLPGAPPIATRGNTHETKTPDVAGLTRDNSRCAVAEDEEYGRSQDKPILIGGGVYTMAAREVAYMSALRGPTGQGVHFFRQGSTPPRGAKGPLDVYQVNYAGLDKPVILYLDAYEEGELKAPAGFVCASPLRPVSKPGPGTPVSGEISNPSTTGAAEETTADAPGLTAASSQCAIATDDSYGYTAQNAVKLGGESADGNARIQQYLRALRGPNGEGLRFRRSGSQLASDTTTVLVVYEVRHAGLEKPVRMYLDRFHLEDPKAPKGLICASPIR